MSQLHGRIRPESGCLGELVIVDGATMVKFQHADPISKPFLPSYHRIPLYHL